MYYEINVSKRSETTGRYHHFFATAERSCTDPWSFKKVLAVIKEKFSEPEYQITATYYEKIGQKIDIENEQEELK